ncbi:MAG: PIN domain-containing protein [Bacillota bacterium]
MRIYLDACCLNRPFDDQTQDRIRLEAEAILSILNRCHRSEWHLVGSEALEYEIFKIPDEERRQKVLILAGLVRSRVSFDEKVAQRGYMLQAIGFTALDALHVSCAEKAGAEVMLTTDDKLVRCAVKAEGLIKIRITNPINWLMEVL